MDCKESTSSKEGDIGVCADAQKITLKIKLIQSSIAGVFMVIKYGSFDLLIIQDSKG
jgi:hypothetical protein